MGRVTSVAEYVSGQPAAVRTILRQVRRAIRKGLPKADEDLSYRIPTYTLNGRAVIYFAAWRTYYSLYPAGDRLATAFRAELAPYTRVKSTLHFPYDQPVPERLIERLATFRAREVGHRPKAKTTRSRPKRTPPRAARSR